MLRCIDTLIERTFCEGWSEDECLVEMKEVDTERGSLLGSLRRDIVLSPPVHTSCVVLSNLRITLGSNPS